MNPAEAYVIGAVLQHPDVLLEIIDHITGDDFSDRRLAAAYNVMIGMRGTGEPVEILSVAKALHERGVKLTAADLHQCYETAITWTNAAWYAAKIAETAGKRRLAAFATTTGQLAESETPLPEVMTHVREEWQHLTATSAGKATITARPLAEVLDGPDDYDWVIPNLLERRDRMILTGGEGAGKSFFMQQLAILAAAGIHPTMFGPIDPVRVLVVDAENSDRQWRRRVRPLAHKAALHGSVDPRETLMLATVGRLQITDTRHSSAVHRLIDEHAPDILVIGPLYRLSNRALNDDTDAAPVITALDGFRDRGCALLVEAHAGHAKSGDGERDLRPRGSSAFLGWPEFGFGLRLDRNTEGPDRLADLVRWRGERDDRAWPVQMRRGGEWPWSDADPGVTQWRFDQARRNYGGIRAAHDPRALAAGSDR